ncbi:MAG: hypothetical protein OHM56_03915 [Spiroplasma phoeniceum]|nr:MAG: hypothetical protein OHM57_03380 [Spiroplasma phoeniceum]UZQ33099.1 MAG: hypothetical protein OHM56_03915 [Spiroplasma phoeniceum]
MRGKIVKELLQLVQKKQITIAAYEWIKGGLLEKSTKTRIKMKKKKGVFQMMNKNHKNKNDKSNIYNFIDKIFKSMDTYDINEDTKILILSYGEKKLKKFTKQ